ncbi:uncharacterized protein BDV17DRAFT_289431 [Aspergillus undulatus]|uniref:uncharacterized protein n=1 Tax=Aspergillus undulatus TaxID=1810928 RepID=UPI003CCDB5B2
MASWLNGCRENGGLVSYALWGHNMVEMPSRTTLQIHDNSFESHKQALDWNQEPDPPGDIGVGLSFFKDVLHAWDQSAAWREIRSTLLSLPCYSRIHKVVGTACGDFVRFDPSNRRRAATRHALLITLKRTLQEVHLANADVACYVQDPAYSTMDRSVLESSEMHVVEDPDDFLEMDDRSLVFSCAPNICIKQIIADTAIADYDFEYCRRRGSRLPQQMVQEDYDAIPFPEDGDNFTDMTMYVKKQAQAFAGK